MKRVHELVADLDEHKTTGLDGVSAKLLRLASPVIARSFTKILNTSINTGHFPTKWKTGWVTPFHNTGNKSECNNFRPIKILTFYETFIQPHINYCNTIWGQLPHISSIHILQKMSLRLIMNMFNLTHSAPLFKECQVMSIQDQVKFITVTMVYKTLHSLTPTYMKELFTYQSEMSTGNTRYSKANKLYVPKQNLCVTRNTLRYNECIEFNKLP